MSGVTKKLMSAAGGVAGFTAIEDCFSCFLYTGNGSTQTITNGIDLAGEGGLVWSKIRNGTYGHRFTDTERGVGNFLQSSDSTPQLAAATGLTAFNSDGHTLGSNVGYNESGFTYASWTFRKAPRFFDVVTFTTTYNVSPNVISHNLQSELGCAIFKQLDSTGQGYNWIVYHRSLGNAKYLRLNEAVKGIPEPQSFVSVDNEAGTISFGYPMANAADRLVVGNTETTNWVGYFFAHDPLGPSGNGSDGLIDCGSYTGNGSATGPVINLGWEPQWLLVKLLNSTGDWNLIDNMRGFTVGGADAELNPNLSAAESTGTFVSPTATGFQLNTTDAGYNISGGNYIYIAIRAEGV